MPTAMPALGTAAQPLRFLDFLIYEPVRTIMLHKAGIPVLVPAPERYAVHKFIVAGRRLNDAGGLAKRHKDVLQARLLIEALQITRQQAALGDAFAEAWKRGAHWRAAITLGMTFLHPDHRAQVDGIVRQSLAAIGETAEGWSGSA